MSIPDTGRMPPSAKRKMAAGRGHFLFRGSVQRPQRADLTQNAPHPLSGGSVSWVIWAHFAPPVARFQGEKVRFPVRNGPDRPRTPPRTAPECKNDPKRTRARDHRVFIWRSLSLYLSISLSPSLLARASAFWVKSAQTAGFRPGASMKFLMNRKNPPPSICKSAA
jgi:hypothetical protein